MVGFNGIFRYWLWIRSHDDERLIQRWKNIVSRFKEDWLVQGTSQWFNDYSISPTINKFYYILIWINR